MYNVTSRNAISRTWKKVINGQINWILLETLGKSIVKNDITKEIIYKVFESM